jgi:hypothetical protein
VYTTLKEYIYSILEDESTTIEDELKEVEGFITDINERRRKVDWRYRQIIDNDKTLAELNKKLTAEIQPILNKLANLTKNKAVKECWGKKHEEKKDKDDT